MTRTIQTTYYSDFRGRKLIKTNTALHANSAVLRCVDHMQLDHYKAVVAEVFDNENGTLHAVIRRNTKGIVIVFKRDVVENM